MSAKVYYQKLYMVEEKTGMQIDLIYTSYYYNINYPNDYTKKKIENDMYDAKAKADEKYTELLNNIVSKNENNKLLRLDTNNTIYSSFRLSDSDKEYDEKTNTVQANQDKLLID